MKILKTFLTAVAISTCAIGAMAAGKISDMIRTNTPALGSTIEISEPNGSGGWRTRSTGITNLPSILTNAPGWPPYITVTVVNTLSNVFRLEFTALQNVTNALNSSLAGLLSRALTNRHSQAVAVANDLTVTNGTVFAYLVSSPNNESSLVFRQGATDLFRLYVNTDGDSFRIFDSAGTKILARFNSSGLTQLESNLVVNGASTFNGAVTVQGATAGRANLKGTNGLSGVSLTVPDGVTGSPTNTLVMDFSVFSANQRIRVHSVSGQTVTLTNVTDRGLITLSHPHNYDGVGARLTNAPADPFFGQAIFANGADASTNYVEFRIPVPRDIDTNQPVIVEDYAFRLGGSDTGGHRYVLSTVVQAASAAYAGSPSTAVNLDFAGDGSGASGDVEFVSQTTLTGWAGQLVPGRLWVIRLARDGDTSDASTVDSFSGPLTISYGRK